MGPPSTSFCSGKIAYSMGPASSTDAPYEAQLAPPEETGVLRGESVNVMRRCLIWWELYCLSFGSVGTGIFVLTGQEARLDADTAIVLSYITAGISALLSVFCYAEFAVEIPSTGGSLSYLPVELGDFVAFITATNIILEDLICASGVARSWTSYFATLINLDPERGLRIYAPTLADRYKLLDRIVVAILIATATITVFGTHRTKQLNFITSVNGQRFLAFE